MRLVLWTLPLTNDMFKLPTSHTTRGPRHTLAFPRRSRLLVAISPTYVTTSVLRIASRRKFEIGLQISTHATRSHATMQARLELGSPNWQEMADRSSKMWQTSGRTPASSWIALPRARRMSSVTSISPAESLARCPSHCVPVIAGVSVPSEVIDIAGEALDVELIDPWIRGRF